MCYTAKRIVLFKDNFEKDSTPQYGILFANGTILCLCCGSTFDKDEYSVVESYKWGALSISSNHFLY